MRITKQLIMFSNMYFFFFLFGVAEDVRSHNCCSSSSEGDPGKWWAGETTSQHEVKQRKTARGTFQ